METINKNDILRINVGGKLYITTFHLICQYKNSHLYELVLNDINKNEIFIDRNGNRFEYILDFLRDGVLICENDINLLTKILIEAIYFKLFSLIKIIKKKIELLYSNIDSIVNKKILNSIIKTIEKNVEKNENLNINENNLKNCKLKYSKLKRKKIYNTKLLDTINYYNELENKHIKEKININKYDLINKKYKEEEQNEINALSLKNQDLIENKFINYDKKNEENDIGNKTKTEEKLVINVFKNNIDYLNNFKSDKNTVYKEIIEYEQNINDNKSNIKIKKYNNICNDKLKSNIVQNVIENTKKDNYVQYSENSNSSLNNRKYIHMQNIPCKNTKKKSVSFSKENKIYYTNYGPETTYIAKDNYLINNKYNTNNNLNDFNNTIHENNFNNIDVYSEINDIEETSHFPISKNINLGEPVFSTTADF